MDLEALATGARGPGWRGRRGGPAPPGAGASGAGDLLPDTDPLPASARTCLLEGHPLGIMGFLSQSKVPGHKAIVLIGSSPNGTFPLGVSLVPRSPLMESGMKTPAQCERLPPRSPSPRWFPPENAPPQRPGGAWHCHASAPAFIWAEASPPELFVAQQPCVWVRQRPPAAAGLSDRHPPPCPPRVRRWHERVYLCQAEREYLF